MSHIVSIQTQVRDEVAVKLACSRLCWPSPICGTHQMFSGELRGLAVQVPEWRYPLVCELSAGKLHYDLYEGRWGDEAQLDRFKQSYAVEKAKLEARRQGRSVTEQSLDNGSIRLLVQVSGAAS